MKVCKIDNCNGVVFQAALCSPHYQRQRQHRSMDAPIRKNRKNGEVLKRNNRGEKFCIRCENFYPETYFSTHASTLDRKQPYCKHCVSERLMIRNYKLDNLSFEILFNSQNRKCAICRKNNPDGNNGWHIDHDHDCCIGPKTCGSCIRGILCSSCNKGIGHFFDSKEYLMNAINYLERIENGKA